MSAQVDHAAFQAGMLAEMRHLANRLDRPSRLHSIFFGGGTPSLMPPGLIAAIIAEAEQIFSFARDIEITAEANPTSVEAAGLAGFKSAGVNRVSLGIQALDPAQLRFLGREHSVAEALAALALAQTIFSRYRSTLYTVCQTRRRVPGSRPCSDCWGWGWIMCRCIS